MAPKRTGNVRQRGTKWQGRLQHPDGTTTSATFRTRREAERWIHDQAAGNKPPSPAIGEPPVPTVAEWVAIWRATLIDQSPSTLARTDSALRAHILPEWGDQRLDAITTLQVRQWLARLVVEKHLAATTVTRMLRVLSALLQAAAETDDTWLTSNPARGVRPPRTKAPERRFLTVTELYAVADAIDSRYRALVLFAGFSGLRFAELTALRVRDINPLHAWVRVERTLTEVSGHLHQGGPKSAAGRRTVSLPPSILDTIQPHLANKQPDELVFTSPEGGPLRRTLFSKRFWRPALQRAGLPPAGLHSLRHTAVATWLEAGASLREAQARAGHSSGALTLSIYGHMTPAAEQATTARLEQLARQATANGTVTS